MTPDQTAVVRKATERVWLIYECVNPNCENQGGRWPVAEDEEMGQRICAECCFAGRPTRQE
jgi:hypothetical protein